MRARAGKENRTKDATKWGQAPKEEEEEGQRGREEDMQKPPKVAST
jgi:hypothetical protein